MPSNGLTQNAQGRWDLTIKHEGPAGLTIPARLTYDGQQEAISIVSSDRTYNTAWYTELGTPINTDEIDKYAKPTLYNGKTYVVKDWIFDVKPYDESGTTGETTFRLRVSPKSDSIDSAGTIQILAYYEELSGSTVVSSQDVTSLSSCFWASSNSNVASVSGGWVQGKNKNSGSSQTVTITATYSGHSDTSSITVAKASGSTSTVLELSGSSNAMVAAGGQITLSVSSNTGWTLSLNTAAAGYARINNSTSTGNATRTLTIDQNNGQSQRTVTVTAKSTGDNQITRTWQVTQEKSGSTGDYLVFSPTSKTVGSGVTSFTLIVSSNTTWTAGPIPTVDWVDMDYNSGTGVKNVTVTVTTNNTTSARTATIKGYIGTAEKAICYLTQEAKGGGGETRYELQIFANPTSIEWSGTSQLSAQYVTFVNNVETSRADVSPSLVQWTITKNSAFTQGISSEGVLTAHNDSTYNNREVKVKGLYAGVESDEVAIQVSKKASTETRYEVLISPDRTGITSAGTVQLMAEFLTYEGGSTTPTSRLDVTNSPDCTWESNKQQVATVTKGLVQGRNETYEEQLVTIKATYGGYYDTAVVTVEPKEGDEPETYYVLTVIPTAATISYSGSTQLAAILYTYQAGNPTPVASATVTSNATWSTDNQLISVSDDRLSKGKVQGYNFDSGETTATITATYQVGYSAYSGTSFITCEGRNIDIDIDTTPVYAECSETFSFTRHIEADDYITWHAVAVDVEHIGADVDWVEVTPDNGSGSGDVTITIKEENSGTTIRDCFVWIYYPADSTTRKSINITQYPTPRFNVQSQTITAPQLGSTETVFVDTNFPLSLDNNGNTWITLSQESATTGYRALITTSEADAQRSGTITIGSQYSGTCGEFTPVVFTVNQEYTPPTPPVQNGKIYAYYTADSSETAKTLTHSGTAAPFEFEFYISANTYCRVRDCSTGITITETNGYDVTNGETIQPTSGTKRKLIVHVPVNEMIGNTYDRVFEFDIETFDKDGLFPGMTHEKVTIKIFQHGNSYYDTGHTILFMYDNDLGQDEVTINSSARYIKPYVHITATRIYSAGYSSSTDITDYIYDSGTEDGKIGLEITPSVVQITKDHAHEGPYIATLDYPYEIYIPANESYDATGETRDIVMTLTYKGTTPWTAKTLTIHQEWAQKQQEEVDMHMLSGSSSLHVDSASATVSGNSVIVIEPNAGSLYVVGETGVTLIIGGEPKFNVGGDMQYAVPYDLGNSNGKAIYLTNTAPSGSHYVITIDCAKGQKMPKVLRIDVTVV